MEAESGFQLAPGVRGRRFILLDERAVGLRATWHAERGFVNLSLWRGDRCVETFHLTPDAASDLVTFVMRALTSCIPRPSLPPLRVVAKDDEATVSQRGGGLVSQARERFAGELIALARRVRP
jgi:hypothetical protein